MVGDHVDRGRIARDIGDEPVEGDLERRAVDGGHVVDGGEVEFENPVAFEAARLRDGDPLLGIVPTESPPNVWTTPSAVGRNAIDAA
jgi:hypothetical protein